MTGPAFVITSLVHQPVWWDYTFINAGANTSYMFGSQRAAVWQAVDAADSNCSLFGTNPLVAGDTQFQPHNKKSHFPYNIGHYDFVENSAGSPNQCKKKIPSRYAFEATAPGQTYPSIMIDAVLWYLTSFVGGRVVGLEPTYPG